MPQFYYTRSAFHRRVAAFLARFTAFLVACWRFPSGDSLLSGARNNHEIKELEERPETLRKFWAFKPYYDEYKSLSGRKQEKYKKAHGGTLADYHELKKKLLEWYPSGHVPTAEKLNKRIAELRKQSAQKNARYKAVKLKADELSQAANEIEQYLHQEQSRDRQKKKNRSVLE